MGERSKRIRDKETLKSDSDDLHIDKPPMRNYGAYGYMWSNIQGNKVKDQIVQEMNEER